MRKTTCITAVLVFLFSVGYVNAQSREEVLGRMLYFDPNLSNPPGQSCATCHHPDAGFADPEKSFPVSKGAVAGKFGIRNSPSAAYAAFSPPIYLGEEGWIGGQFWDGRAATLEEQAKGPFLNPDEMNNTKEGVVQAIRKSSYAQMFRQVYGPDSLNDVEKAYDLTAKAIAAFERTNEVNKFSSKYDYYLKGKSTLSKQEQRGLRLFNDEKKGNCAACHPSAVVKGLPPLFTDFTFDNLGIPKNPEIDKLNGKHVDPDLGLGITHGPAENGKFKVVTLRNIEKTPPYGHNGYFKTLKDIVHFYNTRDVKGAWPEPEIEKNVNTEEMGNLKLSSAEEDDIVAFLLTLTDGYVCRTCR